MKESVREEGTEKLDVLSQERKTSDEHNITKQYNGCSNKKNTHPIWYFNHRRGSVQEVASQVSMAIGSSTMNGKSTVMLFTC